MALELLRRAAAFVLPAVVLLTAVSLPSPSWAQAAGPGWLVGEAAPVTPEEADAYYQAPALRSLQVAPAQAAAYAPPPGD